MSQDKPMDPPITALDLINAHLEKVNDEPVVDQGFRKLANRKFLQALSQLEETLTGDEAVLDADGLSIEIVSEGDLQPELEKAELEPELEKADIAQSTGDLPPSTKIRGNRPPKDQPQP